MAGTERFRALPVNVVRNEVIMTITRRDSFDIFFVELGSVIFCLLPLLPFCGYVGAVNSFSEKSEIFFGICCGRFKNCEFGFKNAKTGINRAEREILF